MRCCVSFCLIFAYTFVFGLDVYIIVVSWVLQVYKSCKCEDLAKVYYVLVFLVYMSMVKSFYSHMY